MVKQMYPPELQLNKANNTYTEAPLLDLHLSTAKDLFLLEGFMINAMTLILIWQTFRFWMVTFLVVLHMAYTFRNFLGLLESAINARNKSLRHLNFSSRAIGIINFDKHFLNFIADTVN